MMSDAVGGGEPLHNGDAPLEQTSRPRPSLRASDGPNDAQKGLHVPRAEVSTGATPFLVIASAPPLLSSIPIVVRLASL